MEYLQFDVHQGIGVCFHLLGPVMHKSSKHRGPLAADTGRELFSLFVDLLSK